MLTQHSKLRPLILVCVTLVALVLLAASLPNFELQPGKPFPLAVLGNTRPDNGADAPFPGLPLLLLSWWGLLTGMAFLGLIILWIVVFILRPRTRKYLLSRLLSYIFLILLIYGLYQAFQERIPLAEEEPPAPAAATLPEMPTPTEESPTLPTFIANPPQWLVTIITLILTSLLLGVGWWLWLRFRLPHQRSPAELLAQEARQAIDALRSGNKLKDTVMECYLKMNQVLQEQQGIERQKAMTPREFERHLTAVGLTNEHIRQLTRLFESVRYGANAPGQQEEQEALACLSAIVKSYGQPS